MSSDDDSGSDNKRPIFNIDELEKKLREATEVLNSLKEQGNISVGDSELFKRKFSDLEKANSDLKTKLHETTEEYDDLKQRFQEMSQAYHELKQEKVLLSEITETTESEMKEIEDSKKDLKEQLDKEKQVSLEREQEKLLLRDSVEFEEKEKYAATKKYYKTIIVSVMAIAVIAGAYSILFAEIAGEQFRVESVEHNSGYLIQNLKGDTIDTFLSWRLVQNDILHINILNADKFEPEKLEAVKKALMSEEIIEIDNSLLHKGPKGTVSEYYNGWLGALIAAEKDGTELYIPVNFDVIESRGGEGDITIELVNAINPDGFTGWANSIADASQNQILKSRITIYDVDNLSPTQLEAITRHELGHAFGLAHSSAPEDLMYPQIETEFPYISECDVDAIHELYNGAKSSAVVCES